MQFRINIIQLFQQNILIVASLFQRLKTKRLVQKLILI